MKTTWIRRTPVLKRLFWQASARTKIRKVFLGLIRLGVVTEKIADAASQISEVVLRGIKPHPILKLAIREAEETVFHTRVATSSVLAGKTLKEARIPEETGM